VIRALAWIDPGLPLCYFQAVPPKPKLDKELKHPDQFVTFWSKAGTWLYARRKAGIGVVVAVVVGVGLGWGVHTLLDHKAAQASAAFGRIERVAMADLIPATGDPPTYDDGVPHFKTERERLEAALKEADAFLSAQGGSSLRDPALVLKARFLVALGRATDALPIYEQLATSLDPRLRFLAKEGIAYSLEESHQIDKAIDAFGALADEAKSQGNFFRDRALFNKARLLEQKGSAKDAEKVYREILAEAPTTSLREEINDRLAVLEGK
jgi:tetratricopeptide (TPR) repeat protein